MNEPAIHARNPSVSFKGILTTADSFLTLLQGSRLIFNKPMNRIWLRRIIGGLSFTSALFIFQACYGTPQDLVQDLLIQGQVKSSTAGTPIQGIRVFVENSIQYTHTDEKGRFSFYSEYYDPIKISFRDVDAIQNGSFQDKDTVVTHVEDDIFLQILMEEQ